ncbi:MAG: PHP domain-containing protein [Anaerolineales bacterium]|nr:PHP domain-containing protein [Anaerolineales bacterium]
MFDAHCHTDCSDGNITIEDRIRLVKELKYEAATITDHDFISSEQVLRAAAACEGIPYVPGIELSLSCQGTVVHMLGYFIDPVNQQLQDHLARVQSVDREITARLLSAFQRQGASFSLTDLEADSLHTFYSMQLVRRLARDLYTTRPEALMPAFLDELYRHNLTYADLAPWPVHEAIDLIHQAGGIAVLAHPGGRTDAVMRTLGFRWHNEEQIRLYADWGLDGVETRTPVHTAIEINFYEEIAARYHLLATSGSDCHGDDPYLGPAQMGSYQNLHEGLYNNMLATLKKSRNR